MSDEEPFKDEDPQKDEDPEKDEDPYKDEDPFEDDNPVDQDNDDVEEPFEDEDIPKDDDDLKNNDLSDNLKVSIDEQGLDENQKLRKWKDLLNQHIQQVQKLRRRNNNLRSQLKRLGDKAEKLVQQNVRKQKLLEQKLDPKHYNLAEKKILYEIKNGKSKADFADKIDQRILDKLISIDNTEQANAQMREQIKALKDRNKNLNQTEEINKLSNEVILAEKLIADEEKLLRKMILIKKEQELELKKQQSDCDYESRLVSLKEQVSTLKNDIKVTQKEELDQTRKEFELNNYYTELQKIYRQMCNKLNKPCEEKEIFNQNEFEYLSVKQKFAKEVQEQNQQKFLKQKEKQKQPEKTDDLNKALKEFQTDNSKFQKLKDEVTKLQTDFEKQEQAQLKEKKALIEQYSKVSEEVAQLAKQLKEKELLTKSTVTKLNDLYRQIQLQDRKQVLEPTQSTQQKPESFMFGKDNKTETCLPFDDSKNFDWTSIMTINKITVCKNKKNDLIIGLELIYGNPENKDEQKTTKHLGLSEGDMEKEHIDITPEDKLSYVSGYYNKEQIIFLKFETIKKRIIQVGNMKYKDNSTKDFRLEIKDREILGFNGILDYTQESQNPSERYLVAIGLNLKQKELDRTTKKRLKKQKIQEEQEKQRVPVDHRKIIYAFKKNHPKHLELIKSEPKLDISKYDLEKAQLFQKEKERYLLAQRTQLGLQAIKQFSPATYKQKEYLDEDHKRKELSEQRRVRVEQKREEFKSTLALPQINLVSPQDNNKKGAQTQKGSQTQKGASPPKQQKQTQKEVPKKDDPKAKKK